jgi:predicted oxidoreductase (fatty acid repression mutant protein)
MLPKWKTSFPYISVHTILCARWCAWTSVASNSGARRAGHYNRVCQAANSKTMSMSVTELGICFYGSSPW